MYFYQLAQISLNNRNFYRLYDSCNFTDYDMNKSLIEEGIIIAPAVLSFLAELEQDVQKMAAEEEAIHGNGIGAAILRGFKKIGKKLVGLFKRGGKKALKYAKTHKKSILEHAKKVGKKQLEKLTKKSPKIKTTIEAIQEAPKVKKFFKEKPGVIFDKVMEKLDPEEKEEFKKMAESGETNIIPHKGGSIYLAGHGLATFSKLCPIRQSIIRKMNKRFCPNLTIPENVSFIKKNIEEKNIEEPDFFKNFI